MPNDRNSSVKESAATSAPRVGSKVSSTNDKTSSMNDKTSDLKNDKMPTPKVDGDLVRVIDKVNAAESILVALSKDPTVDEMAAAIGLTLALDKMGKHATAIYSGETPNALEFLEPEKTFEANTNSLQDFIIALNKEKADHLRYKIEGDFVKVYITPYKTTIDESDLEFSHGEVNVDLVISLNVNEVEDLDAALAKHGRIMHDASAINISNAVPGRLGGIEWNRTSASSVSEMIVNMLEEMKQPFSEEIATALLTGIESATDRFSNEKTTPDAMAAASKLMEAGANQQLIVANIMKPEKEEVPEVHQEEKREEPEPGSIEVDHDDDKTDSLSPEQQLEQMMRGENNKPSEASVTEALAAAVPEAPSAPEAPMMKVPEVPVTPDISEAPAAVPAVNVPVDQVYDRPEDRTDLNDGTMAPLEIEKPKDYGAMMEEVLAEPAENPAIQAAPVVPNAPITSGDITSMPAQPATEQNLNDMVNQMVAQASQSAVPAMGSTEPAAVAAEAAPVSEPVAAPTATEPTPVAAPEPVAEPAMEPVQQDGGVELPPPPAPETSGGMMPPEVPSLPPVQPVAVEPLPAEQAVQPMPEVAPVQPVAADESAAAGIPTAPEGVEQVKPVEPVNPVIVQPETAPKPEGDESDYSQSQPIQDPASVPPVQDPGAFKIPGM